MGRCRVGKQVTITEWLRGAILLKEWREQVVRGKVLTNAVHDRFHRIGGGYLYAFAMQQSCQITGRSCFADTGIDAAHKYNFLVHYALLSNQIVPQSYSI